MSSTVSPTSPPGQPQQLRREFSLWSAFAFAFAFIFVLAIGVLVGIGVGVDTLVFRFMLLLLAVLMVAASPQAIPNEPSANTAVSAIFFIILD